mgnify:CR=1 FL=1
MGQDTPHSFRLAEAEMSLLDKRAVILAYQSYQLEMCNIPQEVFGEEMDFYLDWAVRDGDQVVIDELLVGDVVLLSTGDQICADGLVLAADSQITEPDRCLGQNLHAEREGHDWQGQQTGVDS